jgi:hypothetical protein
MFFNMYKQNGFHPKRFGWRSQPLGVRSMTAESFEKSKNSVRDSEGDNLQGSSKKRLMRIADSWAMLHISGETGATDWATLDEIEREVTEAMYASPPDIDRAESLTAMAFFLISGDI